MDKTASMIQKATSFGQIRAHKILRVNEASREQIGSKIHKIVDECLEIDVRGATDNKRQKVEEAPVNQDAVY